MYRIILECYGVRPAEREEPARDITEAFRLHSPHEPMSDALLWVWGAENDWRPQAGERRTLS